MAAQERARHPPGVTDQIGHDLVDALPPLRCYPLEALGVLSLDADHDRHLAAGARLDGLHVTRVNRVQLIVEIPRLGIRV